jgi:5-methylthioadenosine/S-adenosylhomocysteine deaminase
MEQVDILITHGKVVTMNANREIIVDGAVAIKGDTIVAVDKTEALEAQYRADKVIDAGGKVVMPGLVDAHLHITQTFARTICDLDHPDARQAVQAADPMGNTAAWAEKAWKVDAGLTDEEAYVSCMIAGLEMIRTGTTTFADAAAFNVPALTEAVGKLGLRAVIAKNTSDIRDIGIPIPDFMLKPADEELAVSEELYQRLNNSHDGRVRIGFGLHAYWACSDELCREMGKLAKKYDATLHMHLTQSEGEIPYSIEERGGKRPVEHMLELGCLGPKFGAIHTSFLSKGDIAIYKEQGVNAIHCATAAMK